MLSRELGKFLGWDDKGRGRWEQGRQTRGCAVLETAYTDIKMSRIESERENERKKERKQGWPEGLIKLNDV